MPDIGFFHPQIVHFVIAGLFLGIFFRWVSLTGKVAWTDRAATTLLLIGTVAAWFAVTSGMNTHELSERIPGVASAVQAHEHAGHDVRFLFSIIAAIELLALVPALVKFRRWALIASALLCVYGAYKVFEVGDLGGDIVYEYAGGVGVRSGDSVDVNHAVLAALYNRALLDRQQKNAAGAAAAFADLAARFPEDPMLKLAAIESMMLDKNDPSAALAALTAMPAPPDSNFRMSNRYLMLRADAFAGTGQKDSARAILTKLAAKFPQSERIKAKLDKLK
jgi:uncharacterized membrane protein